MRESICSGFDPPQLAIDIALLNAEMRQTDDDFSPAEIRKIEGHIAALESVLEESGSQAEGVGVGPLSLDPNRSGGCDGGPAPAEQRLRCQVSHQEAVPARLRRRVGLRVEGIPFREQLGEIDVRPAGVGCDPGELARTA